MDISDWNINSEKRTRKYLMDAPKPGKRNGTMMISAMSVPGNIPASDQSQNLPENHLSLKMLSLVYGAINNSSKVISVKNFLSSPGTAPPTRWR